MAEDFIQLPAEAYSEVVLMKQWYPAGARV